MPLRLRASAGVLMEWFCSSGPHPTPLQICTTCVLHTYERARGRWRRARMCRAFCGGCQEEGQHGALCDQESEHTCLNQCTGELACRRRCLAPPQGRGLLRVGRQEGRKAGPGHSRSGGGGTCLANMPSREGGGDVITAPKTVRCMFVFWGGWVGGAFPPGICPLRCKCR